MKTETMEWISVKDNLPEVNQWVFFWYGGKRPLVGCYKGGSFLCLDDNEFWIIKEDDIKYWMPLPKNPST